MAYKTLQFLRTLFSSIPSFKGKTRLWLFLNKYFLNGIVDFFIDDYDNDLFFHVSLYSHIERVLFYEGYYEKEIADLLKKIIREGFICLDIGANVGVHTLLMAKNAGEEGHVFCFEPYPSVRERLLTNINVNGFQNVTVYPYAVGLENQKMKLHVPSEIDQNQGVSSLYQQNNLPSFVQVDMKSVSSIGSLTSLPRLDFIKIDVEGYEPIVLESLSPLLEKHTPIILFEYSQKRWRSSLETTLKSMKRLGYRFFKETEQ